MSCSVRFFLPGDTAEPLQTDTVLRPADPAHAEPRAIPRLPAACLLSLPQVHLTAAAQAPRGRATRHHLLGSTEQAEVPQTGGKDLRGSVFATVEQEAVWAKPSSSTCGCGPCPWVSNCHIRSHCRTILLFLFDSIPGAIRPLQTPPSPCQAHAR